ncbi:MAG: hypothetical protein US25_C0011G0005 [Candidatus Moranbacteria bacterium GW2011_GWE1_36_7]|nr:MAG: hypothetical protein UR99_C0020G0004 [Candidatus Moranbacteria bacterium GW2011_GWD2_36_12]KKQ06139.1 MAG: hypothetical protein US16_C0023G0004 [Candidatus Moranbacteria bacterium GW2011_GWE2_36_40]KKQ15145.1 MAG: hypothetical protein US25_C0011G0005 [Candidatus Moranbacteria bacterium GW2011_GWE1_36_7]
MFEQEPKIKENIPSTNEAQKPIESVIENISTPKIDIAKAGAYEQRGIKNKLGKLAKIFTLASALSFAAADFSEAFASQEKGNNIQKKQEISQKENTENAAKEFVHKLAKISGVGLAQVLVQYEATRQTSGHAGYSSNEAVESYKEKLRKIALSDKDLDGSQRHFVMTALAEN